MPLPTESYLEVVDTEYRLTCGLCRDNGQPWRESVTNTKERRRASLAHFKERHPELVARYFERESR